MDTVSRGPRRVFSDQFKAEAVAMVVELGRSRAQVAGDLELNLSTLNRWVAKAIGSEGKGSGSHRRPAVVGSDDPLEKDKRIAELELENAFLKKAAAFFARESL